MITAVKFLFLVVCLSTLLLCLTRAEYFTAISDVEPLLETHKRIIDDLEDYIQKEEERLSTLKTHLDVYKVEHQKAMEDIPNYLGNPINAFTLIKRLTSDMDFIKKSIEIGSEYIKNITILNNDSNLKYPTAEDLAGAAHALTRLQETYKLNVEDLSEGILNGVIYRHNNIIPDYESVAVSTSMNSDDCYEVGKVLYDVKDFKNSLAWMKMALKKYPKDTKIYSFTDVDILEYISFLYHSLGDNRNALNWNTKLLSRDPLHEKAVGNQPHYIKALVAEKSERIERRSGDSGEPKLEVDEKGSNSESRKVYEALCRGEMDIPHEIQKKLICRYMTENHPFLNLAPIKMEYMYINPDIVLFHEVLTDSEIFEIQEMAKPKFRRATVRDSETGNAITVDYRISKSGWLRDAESPVVARVSRRVRDFTGLSIDSAEELQVANYGIGGHYVPHFDHMTKPDAYDGNRIATVLFYMSDVAQGGATVFTELGLSVFPTRGAAAFWLNLHASGEGDLATRHAACPVLRGSKWVCNKWLHLRGQEFIKPCDLEYQSESMIRPIPKPVMKSF